MNKEAIEMQYLLGKLSEAEAASLEERSFTDDSVFDEIEIAEDELIDAYVRGNLSSEDRKRFENKLMSSERLTERVEFAKRFSSSASQELVGNEPAKSHWWDGLFTFSIIQSPAFRGAAAAALFLVVVGVPAFEWIRLRNERRLNVERAAIEQQKQQLDRQRADQPKTNQPVELQNSKAEETTPQRELPATQKELARASEQPIAPPASKTLYSDSTRAPGEGEVLNVPSAAKAIRLNLVLDSDDYASYQATIRSAAKDNLVKKTDLKAKRSGDVWIIVLEFPSRRLKSGEYNVSVRGRTSSETDETEPVANYSVRVSKK